ncbi:DnaJ subfamily B member 14 [Vanrija pseudolonga]|uniref:DnaJ subfamily B member 14 n=1 Tax=Vanrija pseudolonga TaxID=143232 RepID=A0AAF1BNJ5_9TREE|nr:DnaJ subfamily B member 14 [Vanrija pseudolonga]
MTTSPTAPNTASAPSTHYAALELTPNATDAEIRKAYRRLALAQHPDRCSAADATERFQRLEHAYSILINPAARAKYDWELEDTCRIPRPPRRAPVAADPPPWANGGDGYGAAAMHDELERAASATRVGMPIPFLPFLALLNPALHDRVQADPSYAAMYLASQEPKFNEFRRDMFRDLMRGRR